MKTTALAAGLLGAIAFGAAAYGIDTAMDTTRSLMSRGDHDRELRAIESRTRSALDGCGGLSAQAAALCAVRARADERIATAELEARYFGTVQARAEELAVRARSGFDVARAECLARSETRRAACLSSARADYAKALARAKLAAI